MAQTADLGYVLARHDALVCKLPITVKSGKEQSIATSESKFVFLFCILDFINITSEQFVLGNFLKLFPFYNFYNIDEALVLPTDYCVLVQCGNRENVMLSLNAVNDLKRSCFYHVNHLLLSADKK